MSESIPMKTIVIAHPRSGSNSLVEILNAHPEIAPVVNEPFSEGFASWDPSHQDYRRRLIEGEPFASLVDEVLRDAGGMKELSYHLESAHLRELVDRPDTRIITLERRNRLATATSQVIAERVGLWKTWDASRPLAEHYEDVGPLDIDTVRSRMEWTAHEVERVRAVTRDADVFRLAYEDLFARPSSEQDTVLHRLWEFLGVPRISTREIDHFLSREVQQARPETYGKVPNLRQIEESLGDDETGHLDIRLFGTGA